MDIQTLLKKCPDRMTVKPQQLINGYFCYIF